MQDVPDVVPIIIKTGLSAPSLGDSVCGVQYTANTGQVNTGVCCVFANTMQLLLGY